MANFCVKIFWTIVIYIVSPILGLVFLGLGVFRWTVGKLVRNLEPGMGSILTASSSPAGADNKTKPKMTLFPVSTYEGSIDFETLRTEFESRVVFARDEDGNLLRPELRQYITQRFGFSFWKYDPFFSIENHVHVYNGKYREEFEKAAEVTPEMVLRAGDDLLSEPFVAKRSPWEVHVFYNYKDSPGSAVSTAMGFRIHHALADGFSILGMTMDFLNEPMTKLKLSRAPRQCFCAPLFRTLGFAILAPYELVSETLEAIDAPTWKLDEQDKRETNNFGVTPVLPLPMIKEVVNLTKTSFTAVVLACFAASLRRFMSEAGFDIPKKIHCVMPLPKPGHPVRKMRNFMNGCMAKLPVGLSDPIARLQGIHQDLLHLRNSTYPDTAFQVIRMAGLCFQSCIAGASNSVTTSIVSSFSGPQGKVSFNGHVLQSTFFSGGFGKGSCGIGFSGLSCAGGIRFVFGLDEGLVSRETLPGSLLARYFLEELQILKEKAII